MWTCPKCNEPIEDQFDSCWKCAAPNEQTLPVIHDNSPARCLVGGALNIVLLTFLTSIGAFSTWEAQITKEFCLASIAAVAIVLLAPTVFHGPWGDRVTGGLLCVIPLLFLCWALADHFGLL